jgi:hypothetical protein
MSCNGDLFPSLLLVPSPCNQTLQNAHWLYAGLPQTAHFTPLGDRFLCSEVVLDLGKIATEPSVVKFHLLLYLRVSIEPTSNSYYLYFIVALATVQGFGQKRSLGVSTQRELSFGTNGVLIRRV